MSEQLFNGFSTVTAEEWREKIIKDLKGKPFESLLKDNFEGIEIKPDYTASDINHNFGSPGEAPYSRGGKKDNNEWAINQTFDCKDAKAANAKILEILNRGITAVTLSSIDASDDFNILLNDILPQYITTYLNPEKDWVRTYSNFVAFLNDQQIPKENVAGGILFDPIGKLLTTGNWYTGEEEDLSVVKELSNLSAEQTNFKSLAVYGQHYHNAGASATQELGFALAHAHEYLVYLIEQGVSIEVAAQSIWLSLSAGTQYFMDIAKLRAARILWSKIVAHYQPKDSSVQNIHIHVESSSWYNAIYDTHTNMLRATSEAMAGAIGGCDSMTILPFDSAFKKANDFSERIARNVQLILQEESYLNKIVDPSAGSYYIEYLTDQVASKAWEVFQAVEAKGGTIAALKEGYIQNEISEMAAAKNEKVKSGELVLLGVNKYPNQQETMKDKVEFTSPYEGISSSSIITPIQLYRAAESIENERLAAE